MPVYGDIATGTNYRQLVPLLLVQHLRQLQESEQLAVLAGIKKKDNGSAEKNHVVEGILEAFSPLEVSITGSLPLQLEYVDLVRHDKHIFNIKEIRQATQEGRMEKFIDFMEDARYFPEGEAPDWIINGIHRIAMKNWLESGKKADAFLAMLDFIEPRYQTSEMTRQSAYEPEYASLDLIKASEELNALAVPPSRVNQLIVALSAKQEKIEDYLTKNREITREALTCLQSVFSIKKDVSALGLQSNLKTKLIESSTFGNLVRSKDRVKSLIYLTSATPALVAKIFGPIDLEIFQTRNLSTQLDHSGHVGGIKNLNSQSQVNCSFLSDLLFNVPCNSLFVPGNGMPGDKGNPFIPKDAIKAAADYRHLFSALRNVLREENLIDIPAAIGEELLLERYESSKWNSYKKRLQLLAGLSRKGNTIRDGGENRYLHHAGHVIQALSVMDPEYAHFNLDPRHLKAVLSGNYGKALPFFDELIETIAANPEADEKHRTTATQLFHRMKLLEFEFYKDQLIHQVKWGFDDYACNVLASMHAQ